MTRLQRDTLRRMLALALLLLTAATLLFRHAVAPAAAELLAIQVDNQASDAINAAIAEQIADGEIDYEAMIHIEKDAQGSITALRTNAAEVNRLKSAVLRRVDEKLEQMSVEEISVPLGSAVLPELFSGRGPQVCARVLAVRTTDAVFRNSFLEAGLNQTLHRIFIDIHVVITILTYDGTREVPVDSAVLAAETVIVGAVPQSYFGMEELP